MKIYSKMQLRRLMKQAYHEGILDGVKLQKNRGPKPKQIEVRVIGQGL